jgi:hypothetical protein
MVTHGVSSGRSKTKELMFMVTHGVSSGQSKTKELMFMVTHGVSSGQSKTYAELSEYSVFYLCSGICVWEIKSPCVHQFNFRWKLHIVFTIDQVKYGTGSRLSQMFLGLPGLTNA